jgi:hypothetical protein
VVIAKGKDGIVAMVIMGEGDKYIPDNLNDERIVIFRQDTSTGRQLQLIKGLGALAPPELLRPAIKAACNYEKADGNPLHEHEDGSWWFYEATWNMERGPYPSEDIAYDALAQYCKELEAAKEHEAAIMEELARVTSFLQKAQHDTKSEETK